MTGHVQKLAFVDRVKVKLNTSEYQEFLRCLNLFSKEIISQPEVHSLVENLIGVYPDLMDAFRTCVSLITFLSQKITNHPVFFPSLNMFQVASKKVDDSVFFASVGIVQNQSGCCVR
ncbi:hypothetical protein YC2023_016473 [Brassica napus]